jgi:hypothetical protein
MLRVSFLLVIFLAGFFAFPAKSLGVMSSSNYTIFADSIDSGGMLSASGTYSLEDTIGESPVATSTGGTYEIIPGYQAMDWNVLLLEVPNGTIDFGTLTLGEVASSTMIFSISSNAASGYVLSVGSVSGTGLTNVADGSVTAGQEEYGLAVSGVDASFADDRGVTAGLNIAASSSPVVLADTMVTFKAAISSASVAGARSQSIVFSISTNL